MHLLILILGSVLLPKAYTLTCHECIPGLSGSCTDTSKDCSSLGQCSSVRVVSSVGGTELANVNMKSCAVADQCLSGSVNFGASRTTISTKCCFTDLCNSQTVPAPRVPSPNGKKCYGCNEKGECNSILSCLGDEDRCISTTVDAAGKKMTLKGCTSKTMCSGITSAQAAGAIGTEISCCEGDMCNSASSTGVSFLLLVTPMVSFALFF
ncbi:phospholipase A2 inhibitor NAI-like [Centroberyx affinis]|uniref:phospholipase A2 inhibitor NAI-like n=1 Tax=Centroberyx affinis TaxID=166261 RepID=UPI003A5BB57D